MASALSPTPTVIQQALLGVATLPAATLDSTSIIGVFTADAAQPYGSTTQAALLVGQAGSVTASTTQTLVGATQLVPGINLVNAANASDAVKLPKAVAGITCVVITVGSTATPQIFPGQSADKIDGGTAAASVNLTAAHRGATFYCAVAGNFVSSLFGAVSS